MSLPILLAVGGHDPTGGAGIQADIEAACLRNVHCTTLVTTLTVQNSHSVEAQRPIDIDWINLQAKNLARDITPTAIKFGALGSKEMVKWASGLAKDYSTDGKHIPIVCDPVMGGGGGGSLSSLDMPSAICEHLLPYIDIITPNIDEVRKLTGESKEQDGVDRLFNFGAKAILVTGGHDESEMLCNRLYTCGQLKKWEQPRVKGQFHGTGCTIAALIAAELAKSTALEEAIDIAQREILKCIQSADRLGEGQLFPNRFR